MTIFKQSRDMLGMDERGQAVWHRELEISSVAPRLSPHRDHSTTRGRMGRAADGDRDGGWRGAEPGAGFPWGWGGHAESDSGHSPLTGEFTKAH